MKLAVYAGSFDPPTIGHLAIIERAAAMFDGVLVLVAVNPDKHGLLPAGQRVALLRQIVQEEDWNNVGVSFTDGYVYEECLALEEGEKAVFLVRGLRGAADLAYELEVAAFNAAKGVDTVFIPAAKNLVEVSSSALKDMVRKGDPRARLYAASVAVYEATAARLFNPDSE